MLLDIFYENKTIRTISSGHKTNRDIIQLWQFMYRVAPDDRFGNFSLIRGANNFY